MFELKTNEKSKKAFRFGNVNDFDAGFFYEDTVGSRYLCLQDGNGNRDKYLVCISVASNSNKYQKVGNLYGKYSQVELRLVEPGTEFTFTQSDPTIPF